MIFQGYLFSVLYVFACLALALLLHKVGLPKKYTRKVVHILVGFEWCILYHFHGAGIHFLIVCLFFLIVLAVAYKGNLMPMISSDGENAPGTVYYAVAMSGVAIVGCFVPEVMLPFGIGIMCTSVGDGFAGVVGQLVRKYNPRIFGNKTLFGCLANFVASSLSAFVIAQIFSINTLEPWHFLAIGLLSVELEAVTGWGLDNISITWGITALTYGFMFYANINNYLAPILITPLIIAFAVQKKALTSWGVVGAILMDIVISLALGNFGFVILITFFVGSLIVDKAKKLAKKRGRTEETAKGEHRDVIQVIANGFVGSAMACAYIFSHGNPIFIVAFIASFAEAFADTVASGIGAFAKHTFDPFRMRNCESGISGGMSVVGTVASAIGAFLLSTIALPFGFGWQVAVIAGACAFLGVIFDSFLGSLFQVKYKCRLCSKITEKRQHCDLPTEHYRGFVAIDNDVVNFSSGVFTTALAIIVCLIV